MIICTKCGIEKEDEEFRWRNKAKGLRRRTCKECLKKIDKEYYKNNPERQEKVTLARERNRQKAKDFVKECKEKCSCEKCGETRSYVLDFHHKDPLKKSFEICSSENRSIDNIKKEIEKCGVLCANCHRELHYLNLSYEDYINN